MIQGDLAVLWMEGGMAVGFVLMGKLGAGSCVGDISWRGAETRGMVIGFVWNGLVYMRLRVILALLGLFGLGGNGMNGRPRL